ncbi:MAG: multicopper oxidase domain-containing protein, partial [Candidatus Sulfotelmatobacter sp.]
MRHLGRCGIALLVLFSAWASPAENSSLPLVMANDNRTPAGQLKDGVLSLELEISQGRWYPEDEKGQYRDAYAFGEKGRSPESSGPLIRVPQGTQLRITIHNTLPLAVRIHGLHAHPGDPNDTVNLEPGGTRELEFPAGEPGTYPYWGTTSGTSLKGRRAAETLLSGAFIVDAPGMPEQDRIFVLSVWLKVGPSEVELIPSINGKSWPYT